MTTVYNLEKEASLASVVEADLFWTYKASTKSYGSTSVAVMRQAISSGLATVADATVTITSAYAGKTIVLNRAAGIAVTLPAATGSGNVYTFIVATTFTGESTIKVVGNDVMKGTALLFADSGDTTLGFATAADSDTITFTATNTTGGIAGARVQLQDIAADTWYVNIVSDAAGSEASPFSATVAP